MKIFTAAVLIAIGLAVLLVWRTPPMTKGAYRLGFLLGLAAFGGTILSGRSSWTLYLGPNHGAPLVAFLSRFLAAMPFVLLVEAGFSGYRGFSSWMRYVSLSLAALGGVGLTASLLLPILLRR
jgi:hypothetical protein